MKNVIIALFIAVSVVFGFNTVNASELPVNNGNLETSSTNQYHVKVYEDGAIWVYVYTGDGVFVTKYMEQ